jgi:ubiquinol-cytochrome c reductase cytochrome b subunit
MIRSLLAWLDNRTGYKALMHEALFERVPGGARWRYVWGSTLVFTFVLQMITGIMLSMGYSAGTKSAWESVYYIQNEVTLGWMVRGLHHFAAQAMVVLMAIHLVQVIIDGAYKAPRELNFWLGLVLMQIVMGLGLTGYLLPWDQKGYYATQVATEIMGSTPVVGPQIQKLAQGGSEYGNHTLTRFFTMHAVVLPALLVGFLVLHIAVFRRHGITPAEPRKKPDGMFWPDQVLMDGVACLGVLAVLMGLTLHYHGAELTAPANPAEAYNAARPEWYYLFLFRFLKFEWVSKLGEATHLGEAFGAIVIPGILMTILAAMPIIGRKRAGHLFNIGFLTIVILGAMSLTGVALYEDWYQNDADSRDFRAAVHEAHQDGARTVELAQAPTGIPADGAISLLRNDALTRGSSLFKTYCLECHQSTGVEYPLPPKKEGEASPGNKPSQGPQIADFLHRETINFGSRDWIKSVLTDFEGHFSSLKNITEANGMSAERSKTAAAILSGSMKDWSTTNAPLLKDPANAKDFEALVEFLYAQGDRPDALPDNDEKVRWGREVFATGKLTMGAFDTACSDCHAMHVQGEQAPLSVDLAPVLTGYAGQDWLKKFIADPQVHYAGESGNNAMPGFKDQLSPKDLDMLVKYLTGDYYRKGTDARH